MARITSTEVAKLTMFTIGATSYPTTTQVTSLIASIYKQIYTIVYGTGNYSSDDSTDSETIIDTDDMNAIVENIVKELCDLWFLSGVDNPSPSFILQKDDKEEVVEVADQKRKLTDPMDNVRIWGSTQADWAGLL